MSAHPNVLCDDTAHTKKLTDISDFENWKFQIILLFTDSDRYGIICGKIKLKMLKTVKKWIDRRLTSKEKYDKLHSVYERDVDIHAYRIISHIFF